MLTRARTSPGRTDSRYAASWSWNHSMHGIEAGIAQPWHRYTGDAGENVSIEHFGASADYQTLFTEFGFTTDNAVALARKTLDSTA